MLLSVFPTGAFAADGGGAADAETLTAMVDRYFEETGLNPELVSVGYVCPETGESWYQSST